MKRLLAAGRGDPVHRVHGMRRSEGGNVRKKEPIIRTEVQHRSLGVRRVRACGTHEFADPTPPTPTSAPPRPPVGHRRDFRSVCTNARPSCTSLIGVKIFRIFLRCSSERQVARMGSTRAHINPPLLTWARERVNMEEETLARRAQVSVEVYQSWEAGEARPTVRQLGLIARTLQRSPALFYLKSPPREASPRLEMRRLVNRPPQADSSEFSLFVQECVARRKTALDLAEMLGEVLRTPPVASSESDEAEEVAGQLRLHIGLPPDTCHKWTLSEARGHIESLGILVFQMPGISMKEARGFSIALSPYPVVAVNSKDSTTGRLFTLMHEVGHVLLGESTLHIENPLESHQRTETWCNRFSAALLVPQTALISEAERDLRKGKKGLEANVKRLANRFGVSPAMMVRRLREFKLVTAEEYDRLRPIFDAPPPPKKDGGGGFYRTRMSQLGSLLPTLAFRGYYAEYIGITDLCNVFGTKVSGLKKFEELVMGGAHAF